MTHVLFLDAEQADLIGAAVDMAAAAMSARARRVDPEGIVSASARMSEIKMRHAISQFDMPPLAAWSDLPAAFREQAFILMEQIQNAERPEIIERAWRELQAVVIQRGGLFDPSAKAVIDPAEDIRQRGMEAAAKEFWRDGTALPDLPGAESDRPASQGAA
jgi:hypothetical protein